MIDVKKLTVPAVAVAMGMTALNVRASLAPVPEGMLPVLSVPYMSVPPVLDGRINADEWREATAVSGVGGAGSNELIARPTTYFMAWDETNLYLAIRTWVKPGYKPANSGRQPGAATVFDDSAEFHFQPMGKNVPQGTTPSSYKFILNTLGFFGDFNRVSVGQQFKNWSPGFTAKAGLTEPGTAPKGGHWWECEIVMPVAEFELNGPNRAGDPWKFMFAFNHMYKGWTQVRIPAGTSYFDPSDYPVATLVKGSPAVQMTMDELPGSLDGVAAVAYRVYNPTNAAVTVQLKSEYHLLEPAKRDAKKTEELLKAEPTLTIAPGKTETFTFSETLPKTADDRFLLMRHRAMQNGKLIFQTFNFFKPGAYPKDVFDPAAPPERAFPLSGTFNPVAPNFLVVADSYYLDDPATAQSVAWAITSDETGKSVAKGTIDNAVTYVFQRLIPLPEIVPGKYTLTATVKRKDGSTLGPETVSFEKLDEAKAFPEWWETKLGDTERIIRPFVPLTRKDATVAAWGRSYTLNALGLPADVTSQGAAVSGGTARLIVVVNGREHQIALDKAPAFDKAVDWRIPFTGKATGAGLKFSVQGKLEQDGMVLLDLTYAPSGGKPVKIDAMRLEFPAAAEQAESFLCQGHGGNYAAKTTMILPQDRQGTIWTTHDTGINGCGMSVGSFYPALWIGNEKRGLLWYADSDRGWFPDNEFPAHDVVRSGNTFVIRNHIIPKPAELTQARTVSFAYMASPFRPMAKNWREVTYSENGTFESPNKRQVDPKTGAVLVNGWNWLTPPSTNPDEWSSLWAGYKTIADARIAKYQRTDPALARNKYESTVHTSLPLMGYDWKSPDKRVTGYFAADWATDTWNKTEQDYFLYIADRAFREGGLRTIYWDIFFLQTKTSVQSGLAYELPDGLIQPSYNGFNLRQFMMRMYSLMQDHGLTPNSQVSHATNCYCLPAMGWMDAVLDGEYHAINDDSGLDWVDGYPIERMRPMSVSGQFGSVISWMALMKFNDPAKRQHAWRGFREWPRMFDTWKNCYGHTVPPAALDWGVAEAETEYVPFWRNPFVKTDDADILVSAWRQSDWIILMVFNHHRERRKDAMLTVDLEALKLIPELPWEEFVRLRDLDKQDDEPAAVFDANAGTVRLPGLKAHTGRLIGIRRY